MSSSEEEVAAVAGEADNDAAGPPAGSWSSHRWPLLGLAGCFVVAQLLAMALVPSFDAAEMQAFEDPEDPVNSGIYFVLILAFTAFVLWLVRRGLQNLLQLIFMGAIGMTFVYVFYPLFLALGFTPAGAWLGGAAIAVQLTFLLLTFPEWYVINICGVLISAGAAAIFGISFGLIPALLLLVGLALYDAWAVYHTGHMVDLADTVMELRLPILLVMPKQRGYSFLKQRSLQAQIEAGEEREAMFMGLGDIVIPGVLAVSAKASLGWGVGLGAMLGGLAGFAVLMHFVLGGRPQAGLPLLNGGAILGWAFAAILLTGSLGLPA